MFNQMALQNLPQLATIICKPDRHLKFLSHPLNYLSNVPQNIFQLYVTSQVEDKPPNKKQTKKAVWLFFGVWTRVLEGNNGIVQRGLCLQMNDFVKNHLE